MHTVVETASYLADDKAAKLSEAEREAVVEMIANHPQAMTKSAARAERARYVLQVAAKEKSGGYRVITFFSGRDVPVFLLAVYSKGEKANLSKSERNELKGILAEIVREYRKRVKRHV